MENNMRKWNITTKNYVEKFELSNNILNFIKRKTEARRPK